MKEIIDKKDTNEFRPPFFAKATPGRLASGLCLLSSIICSLFLFLVQPASAWVILGEFDWDPNPGGIFTSEDGWANVNTVASGGYTGGWLQVTFTNTTSGPGEEWSDMIHAPATNLFAGTWNTQQWIQFDFWASNVIPGQTLQVAWRSTTNVDNTWRASVTPQMTLTQSWTTVTASLGVWNNWQYPGATEAQYLADLQNVDWIGVYIYRNTDVEQIYGIDNFMLMIPEPAEYFMLAAVVISSGISFRRKRRRKIYA